MLFSIEPYPSKKIYFLRFLYGLMMIVDGIVITLSLTFINPCLSNRVLHALVLSRENMFVDNLLPDEPEYEDDIDGNLT